MFSRHLTTPYWLKLSLEMDSANRPTVHGHLAQLYEAMGNTAKAAEQYGQFIELWKNADPELQPRVAEARRRLAKLTRVEKVRK